MSDALHEAILKVPEAGWKAYGKEHGTEIQECAKVSFVPGEKSEHKDTQPRRYIAIRIRPRQEKRFDDSNKVRHFEVLTNSREWKAGTMEGVHDVLNWSQCGVAAIGDDSGAVDRLDSARQAVADSGVNGA